MVETDDDVRFGNCGSDFRGRAVLALDIDDPFVVAPQSVGYDHIAARGDPVEAIDHCSAQMTDGIGTASAVKGVCIREERFAAKVLNHPDDDCGIVRTEVGHVAIFAEMDLYRDELVPEADLSDSCCADKVFELDEEIVAWTCPEVREEYF